MWKCLPVIALFATIASADNITWTGNPTHNWDTNTPNWTGDPSGRNNGLYAAGDTVTFDDSGSGGTVTVFPDIIDPGPERIIVSNNTETYTISLDTVAHGNGFHQTTEIIKGGTGTLHWRPQNGAWLPNPSPLTVRIRGGEIVVPHWHQPDNSPFGAESIVSFEGGTLDIDSSFWGTPIHRTDLTVVSDSQLINYQLNIFGYVGTMSAGRTLSGEPGTVLTINGGEFWFNNRWEVNVVDDQVNSLRMISLARLDLSGGGTHLVISTNGKLTETEYVLIDYSLGTAENLWFTQVSGLPPGWTLSYAGTVENPLSVVLINPNPYVPTLDAILFLIR